MRYVLAYLDPGTGSLIVQAVLGGAAGVGLVFRRLKQRAVSQGDVTEPGEEVGDPGQTESASVESSTD
jgi:hypothetical protein